MRRYTIVRVWLQRLNRTGGHIGCNLVPAAAGADSGSGPAFFRICAKPSEAYGIDTIVLNSAETV